MNNFFDDKRGLTVDDLPHEARVLTTLFGSLPLPFLDAGSTGNLVKDFMEEKVVCMVYLTQGKRKKRSKEKTMKGKRKKISKKKVAFQCSMR